METLQRLRMSCGEGGDDDSEEIFVKFSFPPLKYVYCDEMMSKVMRVFWKIEARG